MAKHPDFRLFNCVCIFSQLGGNCGGDLPEQHHTEGQRQVRQEAQQRPGAHCQGEKQNCEYDDEEKENGFKVILLHHVVMFCALKLKRNVLITFGQ